MSNIFKKPFFRTILLFSILQASFSLFSTEEKELDGEAILKKMITSFKRVQTLQARISIFDETGTGMKGLVRYSYPGKIRLDLTDPPGKKIVTNGKYLWVYDEAKQVVGRQNVYENSLSRGLWSLKGYEQVSAVEQTDGYLLRLKSSRKHWKSVTIRMRKDYMPLNIAMDSGQGSTQTFSLSNIKTGISFMGKIFDFRVPGSVQLVENPLNLK